MSYHAYFFAGLLPSYQRTTLPSSTSNLELRDLQTTQVYVNGHPVPSRLEFSVTLSCELPAQMLLSRLLVAVSQVSGGGFCRTRGFCTSDDCLCGTDVCATIKRRKLIC